MLYNNRCWRSAYTKQDRMQALQKTKPPTPVRGFEKYIGIDYARSKRSRFITLFHAATKSFTNLSLLSSHA